MWHEPFVAAARLHLWAVCACTHAQPAPVLWALGGPFYMGATCAVWALSSCVLAWQWQHTCCWFYSTAHIHGAFPYAGSQEGVLKVVP
eukprot:1159597-Pelagomonas_calceolata.AAC.17